MTTTFRLSPIEFHYEYDQSSYKKMLEAAEKATKRITVQFEETLFIFSPRGRAYVLKDKIEFDGHLSGFEPSESQEGEAEVTITITPTKTDVEK